MSKVNQKCPKTLILLGGGQLQSLINKGLKPHFNYQKNYNKIYKSILDI